MGPSTTTSTNKGFLAEAKVWALVGCLSCARSAVSKSFVKGEFTKMPGLFLYVTVLLETNGVLTERTLLEGPRGAQGPCACSKGPFWGCICLHMRDMRLYFSWYAPSSLSPSPLVLFWIAGVRREFNTGGALRG